MSWAVGFDTRWRRDIGYGVPAFCDHPGCTERIDRGLACVCGGQAYGGYDGCGLYFCEKHLGYQDIGVGTSGPFCARCRSFRDPFDAKPDHPDWIQHKLTDESWQRWRDENPNQVAAMHEALRKDGLA